VISYRHPAAADWSCSRRRQEASVDRLAAFVFRSDLVTLGDDSLDRLASLGRCLLPDHLEDTFQARDMVLGLFEMSLKSLFKLFRVARLGHFRQGLHDRLFGEVYVLQGLFE